MSINLSLHGLKSITVINDLNHFKESIQSVFANIDENSFLNYDYPNGRKLLIGKDISNSVSAKANTLREVCQNSKLRPRLHFIAILDYGVDNVYFVKYPTKEKWLSLTFSKEMPFFLNLNQTSTTDDLLETFLDHLLEINADIVTSLSDVSTLVNSVDSTHPIEVSEVKTDAVKLDNEGVVENSNLCQITEDMKVESEKHDKVSDSLDSSINETVVPLPPTEVEQVLINTHDHTSPIDDETMERITPVKVEPVVNESEYDVVLAPNPDYKPAE